jgi:hypothetical protein
MKVIRHCFIWLGEYNYCLMHCCKKLIVLTLVSLFLSYQRPPYIGTGRDMLRIAEKWTEFAPAVLKENPLHHAEMCKYKYNTIVSLQLASWPN